MSITICQQKKRPFLGSLSTSTLTQRAKTVIKVKLRLSLPCFLCTKTQNLILNETTEYMVYFLTVEKWIYNDDAIISHKAIQYGSKKKKKYVYNFSFYTFSKMSTHTELSSTCSYTISCYDTQFHSPNLLRKF